MKELKLFPTKALGCLECIVDTIIIKPWLATFVLAALCALPLSANAAGLLEHQLTEKIEQDYAGYVGTKVYVLADPDAWLSPEKIYRTLARANTTLLTLAEISLPVSMADNPRAFARQLAPCDVTADTIRITMNPGGIPPDAAGRVWTPYTTYNLPGIPYGNAPTSNTDNPGTPGSNGTSSPALYARGLYAQTLDMHIPVPNGDYTVILHYSTNANAVGGRIFDVNLENTKVETDFDIFAEAGGQYVALVKSYAVTVDGNDLGILMVSPTNNAIIQGIEIIPTSTPLLQRSVDMELDVTGCYYVNGESRATVTARVNWDNIIAGDQITISLGGESRTITPGMIQVNYAGVYFGQQSIVAPQDIAFEVPADGATGDVTATFNSDATCVTTANFTAPVACEPTTCAGGTGVVGGYAFIDNNRDGTEQPGEILRETGVAVRIYGSDAAGNSTLAGSAITDAFGNYSFTGLTDGERYRVEFDFPGGGGLDQTVNGSSNRTSVQFITSPTCGAHIGITDSEVYCQNNPQVLVPCYVKGNTEAPNGTNRSALVGFPYLSSGTPASGPVTNYATIGQVGSLWGMAFDKHRDRMYSAATVKRHNGLIDRPSAPTEGMIGGIFVTDMTAAPAASTSFLVDLEDIGAELGFIGNDVARGLPLDINQPDRDPTAFAKVGKVGLGDIDVTPDGNLLFYVNLFQQSLGRVRMDDDNNPSTSYTPVTGDLTEFPLPAVNCSSTGSLRPWALKVYQGKVYVGAVCDGEGGGKADLEAFVFSFDLTTNAFDATPVFDFPLTYPKGPPFAGAGTVQRTNRTGWHPWTDDFKDLTQGFLANATNIIILYPVPVFSDIEFDIDGAMVLGFMDRTSQQIGFQNFDVDGTTSKTHNIVAGGDVLRAYFSNGNFILENNAKAGPATGYGPGNNQGPGLGEFYNDDYAPNNPAHAESFLGGLALRPGSGEVMATALDPTLTINSNGVRRLSNSTGQITAAFEIVNNVAGTNRKGNSLGDLELVCELLTEDLQIGGYIWGDANPDGVQASLEVPVPGVIVQLFDPITGDLLATTTTDANGEYYFTEGQDSDPNTPGVQALTLTPNTDYTIVFGAGQFDPNTGILDVDGSMFQLSVPNTGQGPENSLNDSNGVPLGAGEPGTLGGLEGFPSTTAMTPNAGSVDHSFDVGLLPICEMTDITASAGACDDTDNSHEVSGQVTFTNAPITGTLTVVIPGFGGGMQTFNPPFTSPLDYTITGVASNGEMRSVIATFSEDGGMCADTATYLAPAQCLSCMCNNYIYLNEPGAGTVLKFKIEQDSSLTLVGDPFASGIGSPHGLGFDANGFVYVGSLSTGRIHKYSCDGTFIELVPGISVSQTNAVIKGNYLYTTLNSGAPFVQCFDLCTGQRVGYLDFAGIGPSWGLAEGEDGNLYVAGGQGSPVIVYQFPPDPSLFKLSNITVYNTPYFTNNPGLTCNSNTGIDVDEFGNVYIACINGPITKVAPDGTILATATDPVPGAGGHSQAFGIVYNRGTNQIYTTHFRASEDCIAVLDADDLTYRPDFAVPPAPFSGKGIGILQECCPTLDSVRIDTTICAANGVAFELADLLPCEGLCAQPTPDGGWTRTEGTGGTFNECDLSFTVDEVTTSSCFKFSGGEIGGACFPYVIEICFNIVEMTPPTIAGNACSDPAGEALTVSVPAAGVPDITYQWQRSFIGCVGFLDIAGATGTTYTPSSPAQLTYYRVKASSLAGAECEQFSNCIRVELDTMATSTICSGGINSVTFSARSGLTNVVWFNEADTQVGTGPSLMVDSNTEGLDDGQENFRYTALDANGDPFPSACPFRVVTEDCLDLGDLPAGYPTTLADNGPAHNLVPGLMIGATVDQEADGVPSVLADGDGADEDGIAAFPTFTPGFPAPITVNVTNTQTVPADAILYGFIDWNGDGDFDDPNETVSVAVPTGTNGDVSLPFVVPANAVTGVDLGVRIRLSTDTGLTAVGPATNGEIEDYLIQIGSCTVAFSGIEVVCSADSIFTVAFNVDYDFMGAASDMIQVTIGGVNQPLITPTGASGSVAIGPISVPGPAYDVVLQAVFVNNPVCSTRTNIDLIACTPACTDGLGGTAFNDFNNDGTNEANELGQENVKVEVYDCNGTLVCATYTDSTGQWSCPALTSTTEQYRVEFSTPLQDYLQPSFAGADNGTNTQFVMGGNCEVDYGVIDPQQYCGSAANLSLVTGCYVNGTSNNTNTPVDALVMWNYSNSGTAPTPTTIATKSQVGSVWGIAYARKTKSIYAGAFFKRHIGMYENPIGTPRPGMIFQSTDISGSSPVTAEFFDLATVPGVDVGTAPSDATRGLPDNPNTPSNDPLAFPLTGKVGLGDLDISTDEKTIWTVALGNNALVAVPTSNPMAADVKVFTPPAPSTPCNGNMRFFGLKYYRGKVYVGAICDATSGGTSDLRAYVYSFIPPDPLGTSSNPQGEWEEELNFPLNYTKGRIHTSICAGPINNWHPWVDIFPANCTTNGAFYPQPMLSDLEIDLNGDIVLGFSDRFGHQSQQFNFTTTGTNANHSTIAGGDILRAGKDASGQYTIENNGTVGDVTTVGQNNNEGPGGGEFYVDLSPVTPHREPTIGGLVLLPGSGEVGVSAYDPIAAVATGGVMFFNNTTGRQTRGYQVYSRNDTDYAGKANGISDLEATCGTLPIQLGNFVWEDTDGDGIQDPCEPPLANAVVKLYTKPATGDPVLVATDTTDANGNYYFIGDMLDDANWIVSDTIEAGERYIIAFCGDDPFNAAENTIMLGAKRYRLTSANTGEGNNPEQNDSDATAQTVGSFGTMAAYCTVAGETDHTNHNFDVGFTRVLIYDLALRKTLASPVPQGVRPGNQVTFNIEVVNQSDTTVYDVVVGDSIPAGLTFVSTSTSPLTSVNGTMIDFTDNYAATQNFLIDSLLAKDSVSFQVTVMIGNPYTGTLPMINYAEIQAFDNDMNPNNAPPEDDDSTPDANYSNDGGGQPDTPSDDETGGNGTGNPGDPDANTDEDDADIARIPFYDLALTKVIDPASINATATYAVNDPIVFNINVNNQGFDTVTNVVIKDHIPCGYSFLAADNVAAGWSAVGPDGGAMMDQDSVFATIAGPIAPSAGVQLQLTLRYEGLPNCLPAETAGAQINRAEIRQFEDTAGNTPLDFDSTPDGNPDNDPGGVPDGATDNIITGNGTGIIGSNDPLTDEDDADPSSLNVFDLAIYKVVDEATSPPPYVYGQIVKFDFGVIDQGNLPATEVVIADLIPPGFLYDPSFGMNMATGWVGSTGDAMVSLTIDPTDPGVNISRPGQTLGLGDTALVSIWLRIVAAANPMGNSDYTNYGEISSGTYLDPGTLMEVTVTGDGDSPYGLGLGNDTGGGVGTDDDNETRDNRPGEDIDSQDPAFISVTGLTLGSTVFVDNNNDGMQNGADAGISGVQLQLFNAATMMQVITGPDGIVGNADDADPTPLVTDVNGNYLFANLLPGNYYVVLPTAPAATPISSNNSGIAFVETDPDDNTDGDDEGTQAGGSGTAITSGIITLSPGDEPTTLTGETGQGSDQDENAVLGYTDADGNMTLDFGLFAAVTLGDTTFVDVDRNGLQTMGDQPLANVSVTVIDNATGLPVTLDAEGNAYVSTQMTAVNGSYLFENLPPGDYTVSFDINTADNAEFYIFTTPNAGDDALDSDAVPATPTAKVATVPPTGLRTSGQIDRTIDAGVNCAVSVELADPFTICSTQKITLNEGATITPASLDGNWSTTDGTGTFDGGMRYSTATTYTPSSEDAIRGSVTLILTTDDPDGPCEPVSDSTTIQILKVDCGTFFWNGDD